MPKVSMLLPVVLLLSLLAPLAGVIGQYAAFLILTITGERLELSRVLRMTRLKQILFLLSTGLLLASAILGLVVSRVGTRFAELGMLSVTWAACTTCVNEAG
jgi:hypothetical protein